jgi:hypothetical protein
MPHHHPDAHSVVAVLVGPVLVEVVSYPDLQRCRIFRLGRRRGFFLIPSITTRR